MFGLVIKLPGSSWSGVQLNPPDSDLGGGRGTWAAVG